MMIEEIEGVSVITLENGNKYDVAGLDLPDYGLNNDGDAYIFTKAERETLAAQMIKKWVEYSQKEVSNG